ncbi:hypothetical protein [Herbaspirillum sp. SJZ107]|uniref:hypothetical protein n=1 Tax=Herbaspirillum sp. SJZ107 TaxID=2572881 RepID=UPI001152336C|nr:hypothetical protein [Herbaspirillum sp. SJZ107]
MSDQLILKPGSLDSASISAFAEHAQQVLLLHWNLFGIKLFRKECELNVKQRTEALPGGWHPEIGINVK